MTGTGLFEEDAPRVLGDDATTLVVDIAGYEGPIDVLLSLAREQKVDLTRISILQLADQYLAFIMRVRRTHLELAADYLVMAAWLAYLKSRLLLPEPQSGEEPSAAELAAALTFQLQRLEAMQEAGRKLMARPILGQDVFGRGQPENLSPDQLTVWDVTLFDLLRAYADHRRKVGGMQALTVEAFELYSMDVALARLEALVGRVLDWGTLSSYLPDDLKSDPLLRRSAVSATFIACLELARQGKIELQQTDHFTPIFLRKAANP